MDQSAFNQRVIERFRSQHGEGPITDQLDAGGLLLLTHTGARNGARRTTPMMFLRLADRLCVVASNMGAPRHPDWYHNVRANPAVRVELGGEEFPAIAVVPSGPERDRLFEQAVQQRPFLAEHQERTQRRIPVVELRRDREG